MEVEVVSKRENPLIGRLEIDFKITHAKEITPRRKEVKDGLAAVLNVQKDRVVIDNMKTEFGKPETVGYAKVYTSKEDAQKIETIAVLRRNNLYEEKKGEEKKGEEKKAEEKKPEDKKAEDKKGE